MSHALFMVFILDARRETILALYRPFHCEQTTSPLAPTIPKLAAGTGAIAASATASYWTPHLAAVSTESRVRPKSS